MKSFLFEKKMITGALVGVFAFGGYYALSFVPNEVYDSSLGSGGVSTTTEKISIKKELLLVTHLSTPEPLKAIYMTACVASLPSWREKLAKLIEDTELNSVVIDIKDYSGTVSIYSEHPMLKEVLGGGCRVKDMRSFIKSLHEKNIYVMGRITVFQDPYYSKTHPELAVKKLSDGSVWKDYKGLSFIDVGAKPYWEYIVALSKESYALGFDELNFDYIRFPSDGNMKDIDFTWSKGKSKAEALREFFIYLNSEMKKETNIPISADLFGMTTTNTDDLNIGQVLENTLPYFDGVYPMVYPSHYPPKFNGWANPNEHVYDVVKFSMTKAVLRAMATTTTIKLGGSTEIASTTPRLYTKNPEDKLKLRPWLQDFDYGGNYGVNEVKAQIQATYDSGLTSWLLWDPGNIYTKEALLLGSSE